MNSMGELQFNGNAGKWKIDFLSKVREVYESKATIEHYMIQCAFKSFEGKNREAQALIVEDINKDIIKEGVNMDKLAAKYANFISTMSAGKTQAPISAVQKTPKGKKICTYCNKPGHKARHCGKRLSDKAKGKKKANEDEDSSSSSDDDNKCTYCNREGHDEESCYIKQRAMQHKKKKEKNNNNEEKEDKNQEEVNNKEATKDKDNKFSTAMINHVLNSMKKQE